MKYLFFLPSLFFSALALAQDLKVMTFNIRLNLASDSTNAWPLRSDKVASQVLYYKVQLLGVQEALNEQMTDLVKRLPSFKSVGGGREDGEEKGEYSAIFYDTATLELMRTEMFWLSESPGIPGSVGWDAAITRIVTWAKFKYRPTGSIFYAFNTHFDHMGKIARRESAHMLLRKIVDIAGQTPCIVTGDFNATPEDEPIRIIRDSTDVQHLTDSKQLSETAHYGPTGTFNGFGPKERDDLPIDYIFLKGKWKVKDHATISESWNGHFASDHFSVLATVQF